MSEDFNQHIDSLESEGMDPRFFMGDSRFSLSAEDYTVRGTREGGQMPSGVLFNNSFTRYGVVLQAPRKSKIVDTAVAGFNLRDGALDCLQFQGGKGRYRELSPVRWDNGLLDKVIAVAVRAGIEAVMVVHSCDVEADPSTNPESLRKRYDLNAAYFGMKFSDAEDRFVFEIASLPHHKIDNYRQ